jgi:hypothetical protein
MILLMLKLTIQVATTNRPPKMMGKVEPAPFAVQPIRPVPMFVVLARSNLSEAQFN